MTVSCTRRLRAVLFLLAAGAAPLLRAGDAPFTAEQALIAAQA